MYANVTIAITPNYYMLITGMTLIDGYSVDFTIVDINEKLIRSFKAVTVKAKRVVLRPKMVYKVLSRQ
ncbi:hypothetical protein CHS0354_032614 [Potamilus streckersoni]|uniref:Uncharacterized protein n=1 Tax=Potamilus streckersoni TaxID=2493646 RepID=A0AAE0W9Q9_9BIVA|nr:hypothetical protein CHS0354_032614 [Potamilus streckersoni]